MTKAHLSQHASDKLNSAGASVLPKTFDILRKRSPGVVKKRMAYESLDHDEHSHGTLRTRKPEIPGPKPFASVY
jgi:hypothetical protein